MEQNKGSHRWVWLQNFFCIKSWIKCVFKVTLILSVWKSVRSLCRVQEQIIPWALGSSLKHHSLTIMWIMHSLVCLLQAVVIQPEANNELSIGQGNLKDRVVSFPDAMACGSVNTGWGAAIEFTRGYCPFILSALWNFQKITNEY